MSNDLQVRQKNVIDFFRKHEDKISGALAGTALAPERMMNVLYNAVRINPKLALCDLKSLYGAAIRCAQVGLEPDDGRGLAYLIPFGNQVQVIFGYKGLAQLAYNTGMVSSIEAHMVYEADEFRYSYGLEPVLVHVPASGDRGVPTHAYAIVRWRDRAPPAWLVMDMDEIHDIRDRFSRGYKDFASGRTKANPWDPSNPVTSGEMAKKTVLRRLLKLCPTATRREMALAVGMDETAEQAVDQNNASVIDLSDWSEIPEQGDQPGPDAETPEGPRSKADEVAAKIAKRSSKAAPSSTAQRIEQYADGMMPADAADEILDYLRTIELPPDEREALEALIERKREQQ